MFPSKNRYENVLPVRKTRVYLREMTNLATQYINANYIDVANSKNSKPYIATQGPIPETFGDFWRMIWEQRADIIVMLTNLQEKGVNKCDKYWPDDGETGIYGEFVVHCKKICTFSEYECRFFLMEHSDARREITQFHYTRWPHHQVPFIPHAVVDFVRKVRECGGAPVVHCSAGVGRTESFILCNLVSEMGMQTGRVDIPKVLGKIRKCRSNTLNDINNETTFRVVLGITSTGQYKLCYCVANELLNGRDTSMSLDQFKTVNLASIVSLDYRLAEDNDYWLDVFDRKVHPDFERNTRKNRNPVPLSSSNRVPRNIEDDDNCDYVNAVNVDENVICTQQPLACSVGDFWRLVVEKKASVILSLHGIDPENTSSIVYWPTSHHVPLDPVNFLSINLITIAEEGAFDLMLLRVSNLQTQETNYVHLMDFKSWHHEAFPREHDFLSFYGTYLKIVKSENMVLTCIDGAKGCGLFLTYLKIMEQINREKVFDGCRVVRALRYSRDDFMQNFDDFYYIYSIIQRDVIGASHQNAEIASYSNIIY